MIQSFYSLAFASLCSFGVVAGSLAGCSSENTPAADSGVNDAAATDGGADTAEEAAATCMLRNDTGGPGQYADGCVQREWIADYAGSYKSAICELTVSIDVSVPAQFTMNVTGAVLPGTHMADWEGGSGVGNDSYYRFTTDTTYTKTKTLNFNAGKANGGDEINIGLRIEGIDTGAIVYMGRYQEVVGGKTTELDCGKMVRM
ncbi:MAG: hypothetical protein KBF88_14875 [Polyangiaceae bacterium]|nr:hypothetical protein [Polyangiaceae bacterium]